MDKSDYSRGRIQLLKNLGRCCVCGGKKENAEAYCCDACKQRQQLSNKKFYKNHKDEIKKANIETYYYYKNHGICVGCHSNKTNGLAYCDECRKRQSERRKQKWKDKK